MAFKNSDPEAGSGFNFDLVDSLSGLIEDGRGATLADARNSTLRHAATQIVKQRFQTRSFHVQMHGQIFPWPETSG